MSKQQISSTAFIKARTEGSTYKELSQQFGISVASAKEICEKLKLPKRAKSRNYQLVEDNNETRQTEGQA